VQDHPKEDIDMRFVKTFALLVGLFAFTLGTANAAETVLKFGHVGAPGSLFDLSAKHFAKLVSEKSKGEIKIQIYGSSQLGGDTEMLQKIKLGTLDFSLPSTVMSSQVPAFGLFEMPYLVKDRAHMERIAKKVVWPDLVPIAEKKGYKIIGLWENGFRQITNNVRPIKVPADLKGIKLRTPKGKWRVKMFQAYGANPSPMALSEVFVALHTGVMDGEENPLIQIYSQKFQEVQKYLSLTSHVYTPAYVVVSPSKWKSWPKNVRKVLWDSAHETTPWVYKTAAKLDDELIGKLKAAGMKVNKADKDAFIKASKPVYEEFSKEVPEGGKWIAECQKLRNE
jgi:tripartite ATP-independent transporter DctP family solute receptor